ncbi:hypothetical protein V6U90_04000 [Micromonospora sp. CPCC 206060]
MGDNSRLDREEGSMVLGTAGGLIVAEQIIGQVSRLSRSAPA